MNAPKIPTTEQCMIAIRDIRQLIMTDGQARPMALEIVNGDEKKLWFVAGTMSLYAVESLARARKVSLDTIVALYRDTAWYMATGQADSTGLDLSAQGGKLVALFAHIQKLAAP